jgi:hypothetical protein
VARIVIEVPDEHKELVTAVKTLVESVGETAGRAAVGGKAVDYAEVERTIGEGTAAIERAAHQAILRSLDIDAPKVTIDGGTWSRVGRYEATYYTMAGPVEIPRSVYRRDGERNGKVVDTVSLRAGVVGDGWLPQTARAMAHHVQRGTPREAEEGAAEMGRLPYSKSSFDRVTHEVGELYATRQVEIEDALITAYEVPAEARSVSASVDRVSLPMVEPRPRPPGRPKQGAAKRPITVAWRMAWAATVTLHDKDGNALHTIRYGAMPDDGAASLLHGVAGDLNELLAKKKRLRVALLSDGAHDLVDLLATEVGRRLDRDAVQVVDFWHLVEKLGAAARLLDEDPERRLARWRMRLLNVEHAAIDILHELRTSGREHVRVGEARPVHEAITYLDNHRDRMNYAAARAAGLPIGSGSVEATCKTLVQVRMKRAGARWKTNTGRHVLHLRALATSDRWADAMDLTLRPLRKAVRVAG